MKVIAHRGNDGIHKENTLEGIINSLNYSYVDGVEFDIRFTKDKMFVVHHDLIINNKFIKKTNLNILKENGYNSLVDVLNKINNKKIIMIEVKEESNKYKLLSYKLYQTLKQYDLNIYLCSFNYNFIKYFHKKYPYIKIGLIIGIKINIDKIVNNFDFNMINYRHINKITDKETYIWTVNKPIKNINVITDQPILFANDKN